MHHSGKSGILAAGLIACVGLYLYACPADAALPEPDSHLQAFRSQVEIDELVARWHRQAEARKKRQRNASTPPMPAPASADNAKTLDNVVVTGSLIPPSALQEASITNVQTQGVDEGDIVKRHGDMLVVLRRGRLFTIRVGDDALRRVSQVDAYAPGADPDGAWYDEMLVSGETVVVIGYSYERSATEIGLFSIDADGALAYRDTYYLRSNDYYDSRNYASRLIGSTLVFYAPLEYSSWSDQGLDYPGLARRGDARAPGDFQRLLPPEAIYRADAGVDPFEDSIALHTVTRCELATMPMHCTSTGVLGPSGRAFYVSRDAVFVWAVADHGTPKPGVVLRLPLGGGAASALRVAGAPIDQLSFLQGDDDWLNVLVQSEGRGQGMWRGEWGEGRLALLRVPVAAFGDLRSAAPRGAYRILPALPEGDRQNRYVADWLLYGASPYSWREKADAPAYSAAYAVRYADPGAPVRTLDAHHGVERIEAMGADAILVGPSGNDLAFSSVALDGESARLRSRFLLANASQGESRTHGFFYRGDAEESGVVGLPVMHERDVEPLDFEGAPEENASVLYLRNQALELHKLGELMAGNAIRDDACKASCVDWYGNARPIFIGDRVFALMGYELVEGRIEGDRIVERRRIDFSPAAPTIAR